MEYLKYAIMRAPLSEWVLVFLWLFMLSLILKFGVEFFKWFVKEATKKSNKISCEDWFRPKYSESQQLDQIIHLLRDIRETVNSKAHKEEQKLENEAIMRMCNQFGSHNKSKELDNGSK